MNFTLQEKQYLRLSRLNLQLVLCFSKKQSDQVVNAINESEDYVMILNRS